jgi:hypothetical protein
VTSPLVSVSRDVGQQRERERINNGTGVVSWQTVLLGLHRGSEHIDLLAILNSLDFRCLNLN